MGQGHKQQRAGVALERQDSRRPGREAPGPGGATVCPEPGLESLHTSPDFGSSHFTKGSRDQRPSQRRRPGPEVGSTQRRCPRVGMGRSRTGPQGPLFSWPAFPCGKSDRAWGGGPSQTSPMHWWNFPLGRGHCTLGLVLTRKNNNKLNREVFLFWICIFLLMFC